MAENSYHDEVVKQNILKMRELIETLPSFCRTYFIGIQEQTSARTRLAYAYDLRVFFEYLHHSLELMVEYLVKENFDHIDYLFLLCYNM